MTIQEHLTKEKFLRLPQVLERIPISKSNFWYQIRQGNFPKPVKLSIRTSAWRESEIDALCDRLSAPGEEKKFLAKLKKEVQKNGDT